MLFGKETFSKKNKGKYIIGYDISNEYAQISYLKIGEKEPQTLSMVAGMEQYNIPLLIYKKETENLWYIGKEAATYDQEENGFLVENLLEAVWQQDLVDVGLETYNSCALLALFVKRSLSYLSMIISLDKVDSMMITVEDLNERKVAALRKMTTYLQMPHIQIHFMKKEESFYSYNLHTDPALWTHSVMLYEMQKNRLKSYRLHLNKKTTPIVTLVEKKEYPLFSGKMPETENQMMEWDELFQKYIKEDRKQQTFSTVYLIGEGFAGEWYQKSVRFLCEGHRVFRGNNLYSKGACYTLLDRLMPGELAKSYVYLGEDKLMANVGMKLLRQGKESYLAIMDGGHSWYECRKEWDVILEDNNVLTFRIIPLNGKNVVESRMYLHGLHKTRNPITRVHIEVYMETAKKMKVKVWDKGFGEFYPSSNLYWEELMEL